MLRSLVHEIIRRRLWPIVLVAVAVAVAAPLLFLKPAPQGAPPVSAAAPAAAPAGKLPARAQRLLTAGDAPRAAARRPASGAADPFQPPASHRGTSSAAEKNGGATEKAAAAPAVDPSKPVPVVITNADGTQPEGTSAVPAPTAPIEGTTPATPAGVTRAMAVDVRFGRQLPGTFHRAIPRLQTFVARGRVIAIFVKYSPKREKAVFAIAPSTLVTGDIQCRRKEGVCRYVDIPAGEHVRLSTITRDGSIVSRRLDVMRIAPRTVGGASAAAAREAPANGSCLIGRLLALTADDAPLSSDACTS